jgi:hypothetical protein
MEKEKFNNYYSKFILSWLGLNLYRTNKTLEDLLESKEESLKQTKRSLLKEVQDSNNLRYQ